MNTNDVKAWLASKGVITSRVLSDEPGCFTATVDRENYNKTDANIDGERYMIVDRWYEGDGRYELVIWTTELAKAQGWA